MSAKVLTAIEIRFLNSSARVPLTASQILLWASIASLAVGAFADEYSHFSFEQATYLPLLTSFVQTFSTVQVLLQNGQSIGRFFNLISSLQVQHTE